MKISAINSVSNRNHKQSQNNTNMHNYVAINNTAFKGKEKSVGIINSIKKQTSKLVKLISREKPEEIIKTYTKPEDIGNAIHMAHKIMKKQKNTNIIGLDVFSPEIGRFLSSLKFDLYPISIPKKGSYDCLIFDNKILIKDRLKK